MKGAFSIMDLAYFLSEELETATVFNFASETNHNHNQP